MGDWLWIRPYFQITKETYPYCKLLVIGYDRNYDFAKRIDGAFIDLYYVIPDINAQKQAIMHYIDIWPLKLLQVDQFFIADRYNEKTLKEVIHAKKIYGVDDICPTSLPIQVFRQSRETSTSSVEIRSTKISLYHIADLMRMGLPIPLDFRPTLPILPIENVERLTDLEQPYAILVAGGLTQGKFSNEQLISIATHILDNGFRIFYNGELTEIHNILPPQYITNIIDGYQYPLHEYMYVVKHAQMMVTPDTGLYHFAVQLGCPRVVCGTGCYISIEQPSFLQREVFDPELQVAWDECNTKKYCNTSHLRIADLSIHRIMEAIKSLEAQLEAES